jgi:hypothetical protein
MVVIGVTGPLMHRQSAAGAPNIVSSNRCCAPVGGAWASLGARPRGLRGPARRACIPVEAELIGSHPDHIGSRSSAAPAAGPKCP